LYDRFLDFSKIFLNEVVSDAYSDNIKNYDWRSEYEKSKTDSLVKLKTVSRKLIDKNGVEVILDWSQSFVPSVIDVVDNQSLELMHNSDANQAHDICYFKTCHQINKGKLYKCPLVSVLPDFLNQFKVKITDSDRLLAYSYSPLDSGDSEDDVLEFIKHINDPIPQCKFCPNSYNKKHKFVGTDKKVKIISILQR
jgi:hypothetical protein